jgi:hypothetical protein
MGQQNKGKSLEKIWRECGRGRGGTIGTRKTEIWREEEKYNVRFEVFTAMTMKHGVFSNITRATRRNIQEDTILQENTT